jgi:DNA-binding transcriptional LysR family regulator
MRALLVTIIKIRLGICLSTRNPYDVGILVGRRDIMKSVVVIEAIMARNRNKLPSLKHILTFAEVVKSNGFSRAAETLHMTQPGVTTHISKLEEVLGYRLLERHPGKVILTPSGKLFYEFCLNLLGQMEDTLDALEEGGDKVGGWVRLAAPGGFGGFLLRHLAPLCASHPELQISLQFQPNEVILRGLHEGQLDVGFVTEPCWDESFRCEPLMVEEVAIVVDAASDVRAIKALDELAGLSFVDYPDRAHLLGCWVTHHFAKPSFDQSRLHFRFFVNNLEAVIQLIANGHGCSIVPLSAIENHALKDRVRIVRGPSATQLVQTIFWTRRSSQDASRKIRLLRECFPAVN